MDDHIPVDLTERYFFLYAGYPRRKTNGVLVGGCPVCKEDNYKYWKKKARLYYMPDNDFLFCHNCNKSWKPIYWIKEVSGLSFKEIREEASQLDVMIFRDTPTETVAKPYPTLPHDSINLFDLLQVEYYKTNPVVNLALSEIKRRKLDTAINQIPLYISLTDFTHKNRLCIPFYDEKGKIPFYQTRALYPQDAKKAKYLSKMNAEKTIFGLNNIDTNIEYLFITEGPIDSMFISKNGVSMAGLQFTGLQQKTLSKYIGFQTIWILDNQLRNKDVYNKYTELFQRGERVFLWPKEYSKYKDINEICVKLNINFITYDFFIKNSYVKKEGIVKMHLLREFSQE